MELASESSLDLQMDTSCRAHLYLQEGVLQIFESHSPTEIDASQTP